MNKAMFKTFLWLIIIQSITLTVQAQQAIWGKSPVHQPYDYVSKRSFSDLKIPESPDPLVNYRWPNPTAADSLEIYLLKPTVA